MSSSAHIRLVLGLGVFFLSYYPLSYYTTHGSTGNGAANVTVLFGSIFGISASSARLAVLSSRSPSSACWLLIARPALALSAGLAVAALWGGLGLAYAFPTLPLASPARRCTGDCSPPGRVPG